MEYQAIILGKKDNIATITLNRPEKLNAWNDQLREDLHDALIDVDHDDETRVVVITGSGRAFCAGVDIKETQLKRIEDKKKGEVEQVVREGTEGPLVLTKVRKPVIAAVNGLAIGVGTTFILPCDIRIAAESAKFSIPFIRMGLQPEFGSTYFLSRLIGFGKTCELVFTGKMINAKEAKEIGLVNQVVPDDELLKTTYEMAISMAKLPPLAMQISKRALYQGLHADLTSQLQLERFGLTYLHGTEDFAEASKAFVEKREPRFTGK